MRRKFKTEEPKINAEEFMAALDELEEKKGISKTEVIDALSDALKRAYIKELGGGDDADVRVTISDNPPEIKMCRVKKVVDEVNDDYLEISLEDAQEVDKKYKVGDEFIEPVSVENLRRHTAGVVKSVLNQKLAEAEKQVLYQSYKDKIGEMVTGIVNRCDDHGCSVNIGRSTIYLTRKDLIGEEMFASGDPIRLFVSDVSQNEKGSMVRLSRSDAGFLKRLFEEQVREIYDGSVIIKNIARDAGVRSKISVYTNDPNIDPIGACIGTNGKSIQAILNSLGKKSQEKVDIVLYSPNTALYIVDALRPAQVLYIYVNEENKKAIAIIDNGKLSLAIGRKGANARVACHLTGYNIDIKELSEKANLEKEGYVFKSIDELKEEDEKLRKKNQYDNYLASIKQARQQETILEAGLEKSKPQQIHDEDIAIDETKETKLEEKTPLETPVEEIVSEEVIPTPVSEHKEVKTTTTLEDLEQSLESQKKKEAFKATKKTSRRPKTITDDEVAHEENDSSIETKKVVPQMNIYTQEELEELEKEEQEYSDESYDDDIDYDDYEEYYDDDDR